MRRISLCGVAVGVLLSLVPSPARAAFHLEYAEDAEPGRGVQIPATQEVQAVNSRGTASSRVAGPPDKVPESAPYRPVAASLQVTTWPRLGSVEERVVAAWPGDDDWVRTVVRKESGFNISADNGPCHGLFQFCEWARSRYGDPKGLPVEQQTAMAWQLLTDEGSGQWTTSPYSYHP